LDNISYRLKKTEREPTNSLILFLVGVPGFEPGTPCSQSKGTQLVFY